MKKGALRNFTKFTGLFFSKVAGLRPATLLKKRSWHRCFPVNFVKFLRTSFLKEHLRWLLLDVAMLLPWHSPPTQNYQFLSVLILWIIREYWNITIKIMHFGVICSFVVNVFLSWVGGWVDLYVQRYVTVHY